MLLITVISALALAAGLFSLFFTITGDPGNAGLWVNSLVFLAVGVGGFSLIYYNRQQAKKRIAEALQKRRENEEKRTAFIRSKLSEWGQEFVDTALAGDVAIGMSPEMAKAAWGEPSTVDEKETTAKKSKERWVYTTTGRAMNYIWFTDGKVTKIKE